MRETKFDAKGAALRVNEPLVRWNLIAVQFRHFFLPSYLSSDGGVVGFVWCKFMSSHRIVFWMVAEVFEPRLGSSNVSVFAKYCIVCLS